MVHRTLIKILIAVILCVSFAGAQSKSRKAILLHQSTGLNYWGTNICSVPPNPTTTIPLQVPIYNDARSLTDTAYFTHKLWPIGPDPWPSSWNNLHYIFDGDATFPNSWAELLADTAAYGIIHIKTCFAWEMGWQALSPVYTDAQVEANRGTYHNMSTSKYHIRSIVARMAQMSTVKWILWTMPPGNQDQNNSSSLNDDSLATWMKETLAEGLDPVYGAFPSNVYVFDLFHHCADANGEMPLAYSCASNNSHPNATAVQTFSPTIVSETFDWALGTSDPYIYLKKNITHHHPRTLKMSWHATNPWETAQYDMVIGAAPDSNTIKAAKLINDSVYYTFTRDYIGGGAFSYTPRWSTFIPEWYIYSSTGSVVNLDYVGAPAANWSEYCQSHSTYGKFNEANPDSMYKISRPIGRVFDGYHSDNMSPPGLTSVPDLDWDRDGYNDSTSNPGYAPYPPPKRQRLSLTGWNVHHRNFRRSMGGGSSRTGGDTSANQGLIIGWTIYGGYIMDSVACQWINGWGWENPTGTVSTGGNSISGSNYFSEWLTIQRRWKYNTRYRPAFGYITTPMNDGRGDGDTRDSTMKARYLIAWAAMTNSYLCLHDDVYADHPSTARYDEQELDLGLMNPDTVYTLASFGNYVHVAFYDSGCIIMRSGEDYLSYPTRTVSVSDISGLTGYAGPYYRFYGNQDTVVNNGEQFTSVTLRAKAGGSSTLRTRGDAIFLLKQRDTVMTPVIIDNAFYPTTPGNSAAVITGTFARDNGADYVDGSPQANPLTSGVYLNPTYSDAMWANSMTASMYRQQAAVPSAPSASAWAVFTPKLNRSGRYKLYEWHGYYGTLDATYSESDSTEAIIQYAGGDTTVFLNQSINEGQWNLVGTFPYNPTSNKSVTVTNRGATGYVLADAWKWIPESVETIPEEPEEPPSSMKKILIKPN